MKTSNENMSVPLSPGLQTLRVRNRGNHVIPVITYIAIVSWNIRCRRGARNTSRLSYSDHGHSHEKDDNNTCEALMLGNYSILVQVDHLLCSPSLYFLPEQVRVACRKYKEILWTLETKGCEHIIYFSIR